MTQTWCAELAELALEIGACGYVVKSEASYELFPAITAVLNGERFLSSSVGVVATFKWNAAPLQSMPRKSRALAALCSGGRVCGGPRS